MDNLKCPITLDLLEDPITLPCGHSVSRQPMILWFNQSNKCPSCNTELFNYDPATAPKAINLAYLVEEENKKQPLELFKPKVESKWCAKVNVLSNNENVYQTVIGKLQITNLDKNYFFKTLLVPIVDKSGSMAGNPTKQVIYSLNRIIDMTYKLPQIMTSIVHYDDRAINIEINKLQPIEYFRNYVAGKTDGGGTAFRSAFDELIKICDKHKNDKEISSMVVIFLTDGEDSNVNKANRNELVKKLKIDIEKIWDRDYTVHSIGFGAGHDFDFLNGLRQIGKVEGAYRFADPSEDADSLSNKINSLLDVIAQSSTIPLKVVSVPDKMNIITGDNGKYWIDITKCNRIDSELKISVNEEDPITINIEYVDGENNMEIWNEWYAYLIDEIASEILLLSKEDQSLDKQLHCELIHQRSRSIFARSNIKAENIERLEKLIETLKSIEAGNVVNQLKLNDMKFEGKYATKQSLPAPIIQQQPQIQKSTYVPRKQWNTIDLPYYRSSLRKTLLKESFRGFDGQGRRWAEYKENEFNDHIANWVNNNVNQWINAIDENGSTSLIVASAAGRWGMVKTMLNYDVDINKTNNNGHNALDLAIIYGYYKTVDELLKYEIEPTIDGELLLMTCLSNGYYQTAERVVKEIVDVTEELVNSAPYTFVNWLSSKCTKNVSVNTAIIKGLYEVIEQKMDQIENISWKPYLDILAKPSMDQIRIIDLLIKNKKADPHEIIEISNDEGIEITWPLFIACEKGQYQLFKLLIKYIDDFKSIIDFQNKKGTTLLWISACNRHIDIVNELLSMGANPNLANFKGDSPLIPCCQKGSDMVVDILLEAGAKLNVYNRNRDNPVLICCRTGQHRILETLLKKLNADELKSILEEAAEIDGFCPLLASTELDKVECIKVCVKYGANLEYRTAENNQIIAGATALHLACFYGRLAAVKTLLQLGSNIEAQTTVNGWTPLHIAIKQGHPQVIRYLLSHPNGKNNLNIMDKEGRIPVYYANINGNEKILEEFFTNKLSILLDKVMKTSEEQEMKCAQTLLKYGRSIGCFEYDEITKLNMEKGSNILSQALLNGNKHLINCLKDMKCDLNKMDDYGVTPAFWASYLGYNDFNVEDDKTLKMLDRVKNMGKTNLQNKVLLNLQPGKQQFLLEGNQISSLIKMSDGYSLKVNNGTLTELNNSKTFDHSLLGFVEKLKNNKVFPEGKQQLESILFESKIHLIKLVATEDSVLQPIHLLALYLYTGNYNIFKQVNLSLSNWKADNLWNPLIYCLYQAVNLLPNCQKEVYRAVDTQFIPDDYTLGTIIKWTTFSICSTEWKNSTDLINQKKGIVFIIKSITGKSISKYSRSPVDNEIIFLPGTSFKIINFYKPDIIVFGQANIRTSTFKITDKDIERASKGQASIIVELEEVL